jgi:hypothetical protein
VLNGHKQKQRTALWEIPHTCAKKNSKKLGTISFHFQLVLSRVNDKFVRVLGGECKIIEEKFSVVNLVRTGWADN